MTSLPPLCPPLATSDCLHLHSTSSAPTLLLLPPLHFFCLHSTSSPSTPLLPPPLHFLFLPSPSSASTLLLLPPLRFFRLHSAPTLMCTCAAHTTTLHPLLD